MANKVRVPQWYAELHAIAPSKDGRYYANPVSKKSKTKKEK
jgi:hypothetical protein